MSEQKIKTNNRSPRNNENKSTINHAQSVETTKKIQDTGVLLSRVKQTSFISTHLLNEYSIPMMKLKKIITASTHSEEKFIKYMYKNYNISLNKNDENNNYKYLICRFIIVSNTIIYDPVLRNNYGPIIINKMFKDLTGIVLKQYKINKKYVLNILECIYMIETSKIDQKKIQALFQDLQNTLLIINNVLTRTKRFDVIKIFPPMNKNYKYTNDFIQDIAKILRVFKTHYRVKLDIEEFLSSLRPNEYILNTTILEAITVFPVQELPFRINQRLHGGYKVTQIIQPSIIIVSNDNKSLVNKDKLIYYFQ